MGARGEVDPAEAGYDMDVWVPEEEVDREGVAAAARRAADGGRRAAARARGQPARIAGDRLCCSRAVGTRAIGGWT